MRHAADAILRSRLETDGYLMLRGIVDNEDARLAAETVASALVEGGWAKLVKGQLVAADDAASRYHAGEFARPYWQLMRSRAVVGLMHSSSLVDVAGRLLASDNVLVHPVKTLRVVFPDRPSEHHPGTVPTLHQDYPEFQGSRRALSFWVPLTSVAHGDGALRVVPMSHRDGVLPLRLDDSPSGWCVDGYGVDDSIVSDLVVGDAMVFTAFTVHGAAFVRGSGVRVSLDCRYQPDEDPVLDVCLSRVGGPFETWEEYFATWDDGDPLKHYWKGKQLRTVRFDDRWERWRINAALEAAGRGDVTALRSLAIIAEQAPDRETRRRASALASALSRG